MKTLLFISQKNEENLPQNKIDKPHRAKSMMQNHMT